MPKFLTAMGGISPGTPNHILMTTTVDILTKAFPEMTIRHLPGPGAQTLGEMQRGAVDVGIIDTATLVRAWRGLDTFKVPHDKVRLLAGMVPSGPGVFVVLKDSSIQAVEDLRDKRICVGQKGSTSAVITEVGLSAYGLSYDRIRANGGAVNLVDWPVCVQDMLDGRLDSVIAFNSHPYQPFLEADLRKGIRMLTWSDQAIETMLREAPGTVPLEVPAGSYRSDPRSVKGVGIGIFLVVRDDLPADVVYNMLTALFQDNGERYRQGHTTFKDWDFVGNALANVDRIGVPLHPGAEAYWKDRGISPK